MGSILKLLLMIVPSRLYSLFTAYAILLWGSTQQVVILNMVKIIHHIINTYCIYYLLLLL